MHISRQLFSKAFLAFSVIVPLCVCACGDDGSSSDESTAIEEERNHKGTKDSTATSKKDSGKKDSSRTDIPGDDDEYSASTGSAKAIKGEFKDEATGKIYKTLSVGPYTWMAENASYDASRSVCYEGRKTLCEDIGRLYQEMYTKDVCPEGFEIPSQSDFKNLVKYAGNLADPDLGFNLEMSGYCEKVNDSLACEGLRKAAYFITSDDSVFKVLSSGKSSFAEANMSAYYALRCVRTKQFLETPKELPTCYDNNAAFFVASTGTTFYCNSKWEWLEDIYSRRCNPSDKDVVIRYKDAAYVCNGKNWTLATLDDLDTTCTDKDQWATFKMNDTTYICDNSYWRKLLLLETILGLCTFNELNEIRSDTAIGKSFDYICKENGWINAVLTDSIGTCSKSNQWAVKTSNKVHYICRSGKWRSATELEDSIGFCKPSKHGVLDSITTEEYKNYLICDTTNQWRNAKITEVVGECNSSKNLNVFTIRDTTRVCHANYRAWFLMSEREKEFGLCTPEKKATIDTLKSDGYPYICDTSGFWRSANMNDFYGFCDKSNLYATHVLGKTTYGCSGGPQWDTLSYPESEFGYCVPKFKGTIKTDQHGNYYVCDSTWRIAIVKDLLGECNDSTAGTTGKFYADTYGCSNGEWRTLTKMESTLGICHKGIRDSIYKTSGTEHYICTDSGWTTYSIETVYGKCVHDSIGKEVTFAGDKYVCKFPQWEKIDSLELALGPCVESDYYKTVQYGDDIYHCHDGQWNIAEAVFALKGCDQSTFGEIKEYRGEEYYCSSNKNWQEYTDVEKALGFCTEENKSDEKIYNGKKYGCSYKTGNNIWDSFFWRAEDSLDVLLGTFCHVGDILWTEYKGENYVCSAQNHGQWKKVDNHASISTAYGTCSAGMKSNYGKTIGLNGKYYYCNENVTANSDDYHWHELQAIDSVQGPCYKDVVDTHITFEGNDYYCGKNKESKYDWIPAIKDPE